LKLGPIINPQAETQQHSTNITKPKPCKEKVHWWTDGEEEGKKNMISRDGGKRRRGEKEF